MMIPFAKIVIIPHYFKKMMQKKCIFTTQNRHPPKF